MRFQTIVKLSTKRIPLSSTAYATRWCNLWIYQVRSYHICITGSTRLETKTSDRLSKKVRLSTMRMMTGSSEIPLSQIYQQSNSFTIQNRFIQKKSLLQITRQSRTWDCCCWACKRRIESKEGQNWVLDQGYLWQRSIKEKSSPDLELNKQDVKRKTWTPRCLDEMEKKKIQRKRSWN